MKILLTGQRGKTHQAVAAALPARSGFHVEMLPLGSRLLESLRAQRFDALVVVVGSDKELEPLRWVREQDRRLPLLVILTRTSSRLQEQLREEDVSHVLESRGLSPAQLRRRLREKLTALGSPPSPVPVPIRQITSELHAIRSALTAILGNAELALQYSPSGGPQQKPLEEVLRGVAEIEGILRRLERRLKPPAA